MNTQIIIVGAGPVGLTLAVDLGRRGIRCILIEKKGAPQFLPKMERCNARTMEMYRRIGLSDKIRKAGLRSDVPMDVFLVLSMCESPLLKLDYPSVDEARAQIANNNDGTMPLEPYQLISQYTIEPLLREEADNLASVDVRFACEFVEFEDNAEGVVVTVRNSDGKTETLSANYLVGCDGGVSPVRKMLDISLRGEGNLRQFQQALYVCDELFDKIPINNGPGHGRHYHVADDKASFLIMQDSTKHWTLHASVDEPEQMKAQFEKVIGVPVKYEMLSCNPWHQNLLLADRYGEGHVFLAGDAVHLVIPTGGLGMNTGVGDAFDLSWKLAASLEGWGGAELLRSYEIERRQVGERNIGASRYASLGRQKWRSQYRPNIKDDTPEGKEARENLIRVADIEQRKTNEMIGAELGYRYVDSPIIDDIPGGPEHLFREYVPSIWPGARLPHVWLENNIPVQDCIPEGYTLMRLGGSTADADLLKSAFETYNAPFSVLDIPDAVARDVYGSDLILLRPDMHVVWRGNAMHKNPEKLAAIATGHGRSIS